GEWPTANETQISVNGILPALDVAGAVKAVERLYAEYGISTIKFKSSFDFESDLQKVEQVSQTLESFGVAPKIRFDVNANWDLLTAIKNLKQLSAMVEVIEYVEQPVATLEDLQRLRGEVDIPIALDETLRLADPGSHDFDAINEVADVVILKAIPLGGVQPALLLAENITKPIVISGSLDTSVGLASGLQLASLLPIHTAGLATNLLFSESVTTNPHQIANGQIQIGRRIPDRADEFLSTETESAELRRRMIAAYEFLANRNTLENV
ncbi:MAG: Short-chain-fatty-acid--CoA ligase, partial [Actinomycetota bacterium]